MAVKPGDILRGKYRIDALIGRGGMGQVFAATDLESLHTQVAIKVVSRIMIDDVMMLRLHREAEAAQRIQSDWVPRVLEVNDTEDGETFLVMERLIGESLSTRIREFGALEWPEVARVGEDVLRALIDAHTAGIVHRDLKPSNVFLALKSGRVRAMVLDFGVCKVDGVDVERLTGTGESIGTVAYMAPEQIRGASRVDERADLYAFGVLAFEMLSGRLPHDGPSQMAILASKLENQAARLQNWARVMIPEGADELIARTLAREPGGRFSNAQDLLKAWRTLSKTDKLIASTPPPPVTASSSSDDEPTMTPAPRRHSSAPPTFDTIGRATDDETSLDIADPHPTQTQNALATHGGSTRAHRPNRLAVFIAACALVGGLVVLAVVVARGPHASGSGNVQRATSAMSDPTASSLAEVPDPDPPAPSASALFEIPADPSAIPQNGAASVRPRPLRPRVTRPSSPTSSPTSAPAPGPARSSGPHITSQPRY